MQFKGWKMRLAVVDADTILFVVALRFQGDVFDFDEDFSVDFTDADLNDMYHDVMGILDDVIFDSGCYAGRFYLTGSGNFRYQFLPSYKWRRDPRSTPVALKALKAYCLNKDKRFIMRKGEEADDSCTRDFTTPELVHPVDSVKNTYYEKVICHVDKDLNQVAGEHYGYPNKGVAKGTYFVTEEEAEDYLWEQVLGGDTSDCYAGCPQVGLTTPKAGGLSKARRIIHDCLCVKPIVHTFKKGAKKGTHEVRWEEYIDKSTTIVQRALMWYTKGYTVKGSIGHVSGFDTTSGFEEACTVDISIRDEAPYLSPKHLEFLQNELEIQYNIAYMLRADEDIPTEMRTLF